MNKKPIALILGAGPGLGESLCEKFSDAGYLLVTVNRSYKSDNDLIENHIADLGGAQTTKKVLSDIVKKHGAPEVVIHNTAQLVIKPFLETSEYEFEQCWSSMSKSLFNSMQVLLPSMLAAGKGCVLVSGATASIRGGNKFSAFTSAKFALRGLTQSLAREYQNQGIHVTHILLDGIIDTAHSRKIHSLSPNNMLKPNDVAEQYLNIVNQPKSVWTHELDLRPSSENF